jgi:hypothetical protein
MDMILYASDRQELLFLIPKNSGDVLEQLIFPIGMDQAATPRDRKNGLDVNLCVGIGHCRGRVTLFSSTVLNRSELFWLHVAPPEL